MDKVLRRKRWYDRIVPRSMYEADFEAKIKAHRQELFADWHFADFKIAVHAPMSGYGPKIPDFALVHRKYLTWWIVEVEMAHHSLERHVEPQVAVFAQGYYGNKHAEHIGNQVPTLNARRLERLVTQVQPGVCVIVNDDVPTAWNSILGQYQCSLCTVKTYINDVDGTAYVVDGRLPHPEGGALTMCRRTEAMPRGLLLSNPAAVQFAEGQVLRILTEHGTTQWQFAPLGNQVFLFALGGWPFPTDVSEFRLSRTADGELSLAVWPKHRRKAQ